MSPHGNLTNIAHRTVREMMDGGLTIREISDRTDIALSALYNWLHKATTPPVAVLERLLNANGQTLVITVARKP